MRQVIPDATRRGSSCPEMPWWLATITSQSVSTTTAKSWTCMTLRCRFEWKLGLHLCIWTDFGRHGLFMCPAPGICTGCPRKQRRTLTWTFPRANPVTYGCFDAKESEKVSGKGLSVRARPGRSDGDGEDHQTPYREMEHVREGGRLRQLRSSARRHSRVWGLRRSEPGPLAEAYGCDPKGMSRRIAGFDSFHGFRKSGETHSRWKTGDCSKMHEWHPLLRPGESVSKDTTLELFAPAS